MERNLRVLAFLVIILFSFIDYSFAVIRPSTEKEVFFKGTNHELEVYKIYGRQDGPTMLIIGGIQGDEPGGFLSADSYTEIKLEKGNLIVIPRTNFYSIMLFNREVKGVDMNRLFEQAPDDWQGDIVNKIKEYMKESDMFLNLHDGWGYHYPEHINWHKSPDRFGYSVIVDEEEYTCKDGRVLKLGEMARKAMDAANAKIPDDDPKKHYFNTETSKSNTRFKGMRKSATWYAVADLCIPAFGIEGSKNMKLDKNVLYHNYVINEFMKNLGIEIEYPNTHTYEPEFVGAVIKTGNMEKFIRGGKEISVEKGSTIKVTEIFANHKRGLTCDIMDFGNLNDIDKEYTVTKNNKIIFRKDNIVMGEVKIKAVEPKVKKEEKVVEQKVHQEEIEVQVEQQKLNNITKHEEKLTKIEPGEKYFHLLINNKDVYVKNGDNIRILDGSKVVFVKLFSAQVKDYNIAINFKGWFPDDLRSNDGDDRGYEIIFPPKNMLKKYSVRKDGKLYPVVAVDSSKKKDIAKIFVELE